MKKFILRYFKEGDNGKVITSLKKKIYFPKQSITPGYFVGTIIDEKENYGVMDVVPINQVPPSMWVRNEIGGSYIKTNRARRIISIFRSLPEEARVENPEPVYVINLEEKEAVALWGENYMDSISKEKGNVRETRIENYIPAKEQ